MTSSPIDNVLKALSPETKAGLRVLTAFLIVGMATVFLMCFIWPIKGVAAAFEALSFPGWLLVAVPSALIYLVVVTMFSSDVLYYGDPKKSKFVAAFQEHWPSKYIARTLQIEPKEATKRWLQQFNTWRAENHSNHQQWLRTFHRGFACRLVYYLLFSSLTSSCLAALFVLAELVSRHFGLGWVHPTSFPARVVFLALVLLFWVLLRVTNRPEIGRLTGVWRRFQEINELNIEWVSRNIRLFQSEQASPKGT